MPHLPYPTDRLQGPHNRGGAGSTEGTGRGRRPNELASSDPWYREPLDVDQALGDVVEPIARLTTRVGKLRRWLIYRYCITDGCLVLARMSSAYTRPKWKHEDRSFSFIETKKNYIVNVYG